MELYSDATTPFGRKVLVAAMERAVPVTETFVNLAAPGDYHTITPIGQIPALVTDTGDRLFDSDVILDFLDTCHNGDPLIRTDRRHENMTRIHLANGLIESVLLRIMEIKRPDTEKSPSFIDHLSARADRIIADMEIHADDLCPNLNDGVAITTACALEYADFRYVETWRDTAPKLRDWLHGVAERPSMAATRPTRNTPVNSPLV